MRRCARKSVAASAWRGATGTITTTWPAARNAARALELYNTLTKAQKEEIPQVLRVWLRYRSEKYFNDRLDAALWRAEAGFTEN